MNIQLPLFEVKGDWQIPEEFPDLSRWGIIGLDVETRDPNLKELGPGSFRKDGNLVGVSVAACDTDSETMSAYFPIAHLSGGNCNKDAVIDWLRDELKDPRLTVVGANILYDVEWLESEGVRIGGKLIDVCTMEALIEEEAGDGFSLDKLSKKYLKTPKKEDRLIEAAKAFGVDPKSGLWALHSKYVGEYAEWDALSALLVWKEQEIELAKQGLLDIAKLEQQLTPVIWQMRKKGVRVDLDRASRLGLELKIEEERLRDELKKSAGFSLDVWSGKQLSMMCQKFNIEFPRTAKGNPSFAKDFIEHHHHPIIQQVKEVREVNRLGEVFVSNWIDKYTINGRVHPVWRQVASDDGGARTGRMASANPNMQQIPSRSAIAPKIRAMFVPEDGDMWAKIDYSQQEPRILVHFATVLMMTGAAEVARQYRDNPNMDIYASIAEMGKLSRKRAKGATLGRMYGMGKKKYAAQQGVSVTEAQEILEQFDNNVPFVRELADRCANLAETRGWIRTLAGRRRHFNLWEPRDADYEVRPQPLHVAETMWYGKPLRRAGTRKALNALIQGSAADMTKQAMVQLYYEHKIIPSMAVHDELDFSLPNLVQAEVCKNVMEHGFQLRVPIVAELETGEHWK